MERTLDLLTRNFGSSYTQPEECAAFLVESSCWPVLLGLCLLGEELHRLSVSFLLQFWLQPRGLIHTMVYLVLVTWNRDKTMRMGLTPDPT